MFFLKSILGKSINLLRSDTANQSNLMARVEWFLCVYAKNSDGDVSFYKVVGCGSIFLKNLAAKQFGELPWIRENAQ